MNRSGLEYVEPAPDGFLAAARLSEGEIDAMVREWGANVIRLPFNQDFALRGRKGQTAGEYLEAIDAVIAWAARRGAYTLLDLQWLDADTPRGTLATGRPNMAPPLPNAESVELWSRLARRYRDEPAVLFDIFNEPHDALRDDPVALEGLDDADRPFPLATRRVGFPEWQPWARRLVAVIRQEHPASLVFVSGIDWGFDLRGMPLTVASGSTEPIPRLVYSTHVYPWSGRLAMSRFPLATLSAATGRGPLPQWRSAFGFLASSWPVFVAEWGGERRHVAWGRRLSRYMNLLGLGWTAWGWPDRPHLLTTGDAEPGATAFGQVVRTALRRV